MSQSLVKNYMHIIFSTKNRENMIALNKYNDLKAYTIGICANMGCYVFEFGGTENHIHILVDVNKTISISDFVGKLKSSTSRWFHDNNMTDFSWQNGYGAFSISQSIIDKVERYIQNQVEHHKKIGFKEEFTGFLKAYNVQWDEKYVWE